MQSLQYFQQTIKLLVDRATDELKSCCSKSPGVIPIDVLFGQLTIDVICNVAFQMDIKALKNSELFQELHTILHTFFEVIVCCFV